MGARTFDGTDDEATVGIGALASLAQGARTMAVIARRNANGVVHVAFTANSAGATLTSLRALSTNTVGFAATNTTVGWTVSDSWVLVAANKAAGTATSRGHKYVYGTAAWTHANAGSTTADSGSAAIAARFGTSLSTNFFNGDLAVVGAWKRSLSDAEIEQLPFALAAWLGLRPDGLWVLDQNNTADKLLDMTGGGANETAITGTAVASSSVPVFNRHGWVLPVTREPAPATAGRVRRQSKRR